MDAVISFKKFKKKKKALSLKYQNSGKLKRIMRGRYNPVAFQFSNTRTHRYNHTDTCVCIYNKEILNTSGVVQLALILLVII